MSRRKYDPTCSFEGCDKGHWSRGYCGTHYLQWWRGVELTPRHANRRPAGSANVRDELGRKECPTCMEWKGEDSFTRSSTRSDGLAFHCRSCAKYRADRRKLERWAVDLQARYGITADQYQALLVAQSDGCALCGRPPGDRRLHVDHDHSCCESTKSCGRCVRGLLCSQCNAGLGMFNDDPDRLLSAAIYVLSNSREAAPA